MGTAERETERDVIGRLCDRLPALRREVSACSAEAQQLLVRIESNVREGQSVQVLLDQLEQQLANEVPRGMDPLPGLSSMPPSEERFGCPAGTCNREARVLPSGPLPRCWLTGRLMRRQGS